MKLSNIFKKKVTVVETANVTSETNIEESDFDNKRDAKSIDKVAPKAIGALDIVIAFNTKGSMANYIGAVRKEVSELIPRLFKDNENLRLRIVAFGDYCDMKNFQEFGDAYQCIMPTSNENDLIKFVKESKDTGDGDWDEFYELVIKKIVEETPWREDSTRVILLTSDASPHPIGYICENYFAENQFIWRKEAKIAASMKIKIDIMLATKEKKLSDVFKPSAIPHACYYYTKYSRFKSETVDDFNYVFTLFRYIHQSERPYS